MIDLNKTHIHLAMAYCSMEVASKTMTQIASKNAATEFDLRVMFNRLADVKAQLEHYKADQQSRK